MTSLLTRARRLWSGLPRGQRRGPRPPALRRSCARRTVTATWWRSALTRCASVSPRRWRSLARPRNPSPPIPEAPACFEAPRRRGAAAPSKAPLWFAAPRRRPGYPRPSAPPRTLRGESRRSPGSFGKKTDAVNDSARPPRPSSRPSPKHPPTLPKPCFVANVKFNS